LLRVILLYAVSFFTLQKGKTARDVARAQGHQEVVRVLIERAVQQRKQQQRESQQREECATEVPKTGAEESVGATGTAQYGMREKGRVCYCTCDMRTVHWSLHAE
jgi:hypothetical protein